MNNNAIIEYIDTDLGNDILSKLKLEKWKVASQYNRLAFDKGIDFDCYTLKKNGEELYFEWDNWFEWKITGSEKIITSLAKQFSLKVK